MPAADTAEGFRRFSNVRVEQAAKKLRPAHISHRIVTWRQFTALRPASALPPGGTNGRQPRKSAFLGQRLVPEARTENSPGKAQRTPGIAPIKRRLSPIGAARNRAPFAPNLSFSPNRPVLPMEPIDRRG